MSIKQFRTPSARLLVYLERVPEMKALDCQLIVGVGSIDEPEEYAGASHALEHCTFLKTPSFETKQAMQEFANAHAFYKNADTYYTRTRYITRGLQPDAMLKVLGEVGLHAQFGNEAVQHEMKSVRREAKTNLDEIDSLNYGFTDYVHFGARYGKLVLGYHDRLNYDEGVLRSFYDTYYRIDNMALVVVGNISQPELSALVDATFLPNNQETFKEVAPHEKPLPPFPTTDSFGYVREDSSNARVSLSVAVPEDFVKRYEDSEWAYAAASFMVSESVFYKMRYELGLSYNGYFSNWSYNHRSARRMSVNVTVDPNDTDTSLAALRSVLDRPVESYKTETVEAALARMSMRAATSVDDMPARVDRYAEAVAHKRPVIGVEESFEHMRMTTAGDVRDALEDIKQTWNHGHAIELVTGPEHAVGSRFIIDQSSFA